MHCTLILVRKCSVNASTNETVTQSYAWAMTRDESTWRGTHTCGEARGYSGMLLHRVAMHNRSIKVSRGWRKLHFYFQLSEIGVRTEFSDFWLKPLCTFRFALSRAISSKLKRYPLLIGKFLLWRIPCRDLFLAPNSQQGAAGVVLSNTLLGLKNELGEEIGLVLPKNVLTHESHYTWLRYAWHCNWSYRMIK